MAKKGSLKESKIVGYIEEVELEDGDTGLQILGDDDNTYQIDMDAEGRKLLDLVDEEVEVSGIVTKLHGVREIKVSQFRLIDGYDEEQEFGDELNYDDDEYMDDRYEE